MPEIFSFPYLASIVQKEMEEISRKPMDGTIQRILRLLRQEGIIDYSIFDHQKSLYRKKDVKNL